MTEETKRKPMPPPPSDDVREAYVGHSAAINMDGLSVYVYCNDVRNRYGNLDVLVSPMSGDGEKWVRADRLSEKVLVR